MHYYVRGGETVNWIAQHVSQWRGEILEAANPDWREAAAVYKDWNPLITELIGQTKRCYKWALYDRDPLPRWSKGRVTLLGDAAHPMLPYVAQGACMALEDGYVLADVGGRDRSDPQAALLQY